MLEIGCLARFFNRYESEVNFAKENKFDFMQLWYDNKGLAFHEDDENHIEIINKYNFPTIVHAVLNISEFNEHIPKLIQLLNKLNHKELIIHPICQDEEINENTIHKLNSSIEFALNLLNQEKITLYLENNSKLDPIFTDIKEFEIIFKNNKNLEFLIDLAHIDSYKQLKYMIDIKYPKVLHIADRRFSAVHEHLPIGNGEIDFEYIFKEILPNYQGKIILEVINTDEEIVASKNIIENIILKSN